MNSVYETLKDHYEKTRIIMRAEDLVRCGKFRMSEIVEGVLLFDKYLDERRGVDLL